MSIAAVIKFAAVAAQTGHHGPYQPLPTRMGCAVYLTERALEFRNLALTTRYAAACQALHRLADSAQKRQPRSIRGQGWVANELRPTPRPSNADGLGPLSLSRRGEGI